MKRDPCKLPMTGDVVQSAYYPGENQIGRRIVLSADVGNVEYMTGMGDNLVTRNCLPASWRRWCREHRAEVVYAAST